MVKHRLYKTVETQSVTQAVEHGKGDLILPEGYVQHVVIGSLAADNARLKIHSAFSAVIQAG